MNAEIGRRQEPAASVASALTRGGIGRDDIATVDLDPPELPETQPASTFAHVVVGVDGTEAGLEACRQAAALTEPGGALDLVAAVETSLAVHAGTSAARIADELEEEAERALGAAAAAAGRPTSARLVRGAPTPLLLHALAQTGASLVAVGSHGHRRVAEMVFSGVEGELLHRAPCSVLVARKHVAERAFPSSLLVGFDGSAEAERAVAVARYLAARFGASLRVVAAEGHGRAARPRVDLGGVFVEEIDEPPVDALTDASAGVDLLIVGSRGLHGLRALGSVSERVAHAAACSVLVVRAPPRS